MKELVGTKIARKQAVINGLKKCLDGMNPRQKETAEKVISALEKEIKELTK